MCPQTVSQSDRSFPVSEVLTLDSKEQECTSSGCVKKTITQHVFCENTGQTSPSTMMSEPSGDTTSNTSTSSQVDSPVRMYHSQGTEKVSTAKGRVSFLNSCVSFAKLDLNTLQWKTSQRSLTMDSTVYSKKWPWSGMMRNGILYPRHPSGRHIHGTEYSSSEYGETFPTPCVADGYTDKMKSSQQRGGGNTHSLCPEQSKSIQEILPNAKSKRGECWQAREQRLDPQCQERVLGWSHSRAVRGGEDLLPYSDSSRTGQCILIGDSVPHGGNHCEAIGRKSPKDPVRGSPLRGSDNIFTRSPVDCGYWNTESGVRRVVDGVPHRMDRLRCLGNAVVPQVGEHIGRLIVEFHDRRGGEINGIL